MQHLNGRLRGVLDYREGIEDLPEDDPLSTSDEEDMSEISDFELDFQESMFKYSRLKEYKN